MKNLEEKKSEIVLNPEEPFTFRPTEELTNLQETEVHIYGNGQVCYTDDRGYEIPKKTDLTRIVLDVSNGFIPLWAENVNLRWRFNTSINLVTQNPEETKNEIRNLMNKAILDWGDAAPISFSEREDAWDFEITIEPDICKPNGCVMARAFFPDGGRHKLIIYPKFFSQSKIEQKETLIHEIGHIFGLRHFFANIKETSYPSVNFGDHKPFSIMNYGANSYLTEADKFDLKQLYKQVWKGELTKIDGAKIVKFLSYHQMGGI